MSPDEKVTWKPVYELIINTRKEILAEVKDLRDTVDATQKDIADMKLKQGNTEGKFSMVNILISVAITSFGLIINLVLFIFSINKPI